MLFQISDLWSVPTLTLMVETDTVSEVLAF
jgi:hypothetical protein